VAAVFVIERSVGLGRLFGAEESTPSASRSRS
jgi:hypothetical protein